MKHLCCNKVLFIFIFLLTFGYASPIKKSAMVYYGDHISWSMVGVHDYIIAEPGHIDVNTHGFKTYKDKIYAYVTVGEVEPTLPYIKSIKKSWNLGKNVTWKSHVMDLSNSEYREFMLNEVIKPLREKGFKNFFFDTLDSYDIVAKTKEEKEKQVEGLALFIESVHNKYPDCKLILNRGFAVFDKVKDYVSAVMFESYYNGLDDKLNYVKVSDQDREWIDLKLKSVKESSTDIIAVDYAKNFNANVIQERIKKLEEKGFIPYISNKELDRYGVSSKVAVKREILVLYDAWSAHLEEQGSHRYGSTPLEYMGYIPVMHQIEGFDFSRDVSDHYAGVLIWLDREKEERKDLFAWVNKNAQNGVYSLFFKGFGLKDRVGKLKILNISTKALKSKLTTKAKVVKSDKMMNYEMKIRVQKHSSALLPINAKKLFTYRDATSSSTLAALMPWGGYAVDEASIVTMGDDNIWMVDPFLLYKKALRLQNIPVLDPTTENGLRLLFTHIDGDAIMNRAEFNPDKMSGEIIYDHILKKYNIPHTVSLVGAEVFPNGMYPKDSKRLENIAKKIYKLKNVETATHTFSQPFKWGRIKNGDLNSTYRLNVANYNFSLSYEINGTLSYIQKNLSSEVTKKSSIVLWTGDCKPQEDALAFTYKNNILNINGGDTTITNNSPWMYHIEPYGIKKGNYYQVYTGAQNENVYTNDFTGPFWGFAQVIQTFELTNKPRRFKPIDIYYHFYSGSKRASLNALDKVFKWAMKENTFPIFTSEYVPKVLEFYDASFSKNSKNDWYFSGMSELKNVRVDFSFCYPDLNRSLGVLGFKDEGKSRYISFVGKDHRLILQSKKPSESYMISANAYVSTKDNVKFKLKAYVPLEIKWHLEKNCKLILTPEPEVYDVNGSTVSIKYEKEEESELYVKCKS